MNAPLSMLRHHVTGAIERGEKTAIVCEESPRAGRWIVEVRTRDDSGRIRWYCLRWTGARLSYLRDGFRSGSYRFKRDALRAAAGLNHESGSV